MGGGGGILSDIINVGTNPFIMPGIGIPNQLTGNPLGRGRGGNASGVQFDAGARPTMGAFEGMRNADGTIKDAYKNTDTMNMGAMTGLRENALRDPGTQSRWAQMAASQAGDQIARQQMGQLAGAQSGLAMQGGLRTGARERLQSQNMLGGLMAKQGAYNQIASQDEQNRLTGLQNLAGQETNLANYQQGLQNTNIGRATGDISQQRAYDMNKYNEDMRAWAAMNTANAMPQSQDSGLLGNLFKF